MLPLLAAASALLVLAVAAEAAETDPPTPPLDWQAAIASGDMKFSAASAATIRTGYFPVVANGFLGLETGADLPAVAIIGESPIWPFAGASFHEGGNSQAKSGLGHQTRCQGAAPVHTRVSRHDDGSCRQAQQAQHTHSTGAPAQRR